MRPANAFERELHAQADAARARSYSPYSRFDVGAALALADGGVITGVNVENVSFGVTICAEQAAIARAVSEGHRSFTAIAVSGPASSVSPCGACRQVLREFGGTAMTVTFPHNGSLVTATLEELLPAGFASL